MNDFEIILNAWNLKKKRKLEQAPRCLITIKRVKNIDTANELPIILNVNPRSVYNKLNNLKEFILERNHHRIRKLMMMNLRVILRQGVSPVRHAAQRLC